MCSQSCGVLLAELGLEKQPRERFLEEKDYEFLFGYLRSVTVMLDETFFIKLASFTTSVLKLSLTVMMKHF